MILFDTHAHLADPQIANRLSEVLDSAHAAGIKQITCVGTDLASSIECLEISHRHEGLYASVGFHPNSCCHATDAQWQEIGQLATDSRVVAIGETGLDCHWDECPVATQRNWFARHIELSHQTKKPLVVHQRESEQLILEVLAEHQRDGCVRGIMHSFTGTRETAEACLEYGMYISFAGMVTFKNAQAIRDIVQRVPPERLLIETDSPYLTPHPFRGQRPNEPKMLVHTAQHLAEMLGYTLDEFAALTTGNANRVFAIGQRADS